MVRRKSPVQVRQGAHGGRSQVVRQWIVAPLFAGSIPVVRLPRSTTTECLLAQKSRRKERVDARVAKGGGL